MNWKIFSTDSVLTNPYVPARHFDGESTDIPQPLIVSVEPSKGRPKATPMFKNLAAAQGYVAMHLFINSNMDPQNGIAGKSASQAAADAAARSGAIIGAAGGLIQELCEE